MVVSGAAVALAQSTVDRDLLAKIRSEAVDHSQAAPVFDMFTVTIGPRLTASPAHKRPRITAIRAALRRHIVPVCST